MLGRRHQIASLQSDFYWHQFRKMMRRLLIALSIILLLLLANIYLILAKPVPKYYGNTMDGEILPMPTPILMQ